jgi:hypothetical protein
MVMSKDDLTLEYVDYYNSRIELQFGKVFYIVKYRFFKRMIAAGLLATLMTGVAGCGMDSGDSEETMEEDYDESNDEDEEVDSIKPNKRAFRSSKNPTEFEVDTTFADATYANTSPDLIRWLCATYAIQTDANELDLTTIGGMERDDSNIDVLVQGLKAGWSVTDRDSAIEVVTGLAADNGYDDDDAWDLSRAEQVLGLAYCTGYLELDEYLEYAVPIGRMIQERYSSWDELGDNYLRYYMTWVSKGGFGRAGDINQRMCSHEYFVAAAEYYTGPYTMDFDLELAIDTVASYYTNLNPNKKEPADDKIPEYIKGYITPEELGVRADSGIVSLDGDTYMMPISVAALLDKGWMVDKGSKDTKIDSNKTDITFTRRGKFITLGVYGFTNCSSAIENGTVPRLYFSELEDIELILPGDIKLGTSENDVYDALRNGGVSDDDLDIGNSEVKYPLCGIGEMYNGSEMTIIFDSRDNTVKEVIMYCIAPHASSNETSLRTDFSQLESRIKDCRRDQFLSDAITGGPRAVRKTLSDDPEDYMFAIGNKAISLGGTVDDITALGFVPDPKYYDETTVVKPGDYYNFYTDYRGISSYSVIFGYENTTSEDVKITDAELNLFMVTLNGWQHPESVTISMAKGISLAYSTKDDVEKALGRLERADKEDVEIDGVPYSFFEKRYDTGIIRFAISHEDKTVGNIIFIKVAQ